MGKLELTSKNLLVDRYGKPLSGGYGYESADRTRYNQDFTTTQYSPQQLLGLAYRVLRARAQDLERNSDHCRRFLAVLENNVIGHNGIRLQSKATRSATTDTPDRQAIRLIEDTWLDWAQDPTVEGDDSFVDVLTMLLRRWLVDGEVFVETLPGHDNAHRFAIRVWGADACPLGYSDETRNICNGIRYDKWGKPLAYYFHRSGYSHWATDDSDLIEVSAARCHHLYTKERTGQRRGVTAFASTAERMHMLASLEKSVLIGTRIAASKMGFFRDPDGETLREYNGDGAESEQSFNNTIDIQPGQFEDIGRKLFEKFDVDYPINNYDTYVHEIIRAAATGLNISYHLIANDPGSVNYSTAREFRLQDTDEFRRRQHAIARKICQPVFASWLQIQLLTPDFARYKQADYKRLSYVKWQPRGWQWVDPQKEANGNMLAVQMGVKSLTDIAAEQGRDYEEVIEQIKQDMDYAASKGVDLSAVWQTVATTEDESENNRGQA